MKITIIKERCVPLEAAEVITRCVNGDSYQETKNRFLMRYGSRFNDKSRDKFIEKMNAIEEVFLKLQNDVVEDEMTSFLFQKHYYGNTYSILGQLMLINFQEIDASGWDAYFEVCKNRWKTLMNSKVKLTAVVYSALVFEESDRPWKENLLEDIDNLNYPVEFKWSLYKVLNRYEEYLDDLKTILFRMVKPLKKALKELNPFINEMEAFWEANLNEETLEEMAESMNLSKDDVLGKEVILQLLCMPCAQAIMDDQWKKDKVPLYLGISIEWGSQFSDEQIDRRLLCEQLRAFSEDSKFEIMQLLKSEGSYGQEIARKLKLDAATVSRHLSVLQKHGLVYIERKEKRNIYYKINRNELRNILELMQKIFLDE